MMDYYDRKDNPAFGNTMSAGKFLSRFLHKLMSKRCLFILSPLIFVLVMPAFAAALPSTPTGVSATAVSSDEIQVSWNTSTNANGYELWRSSTIDGTSPGTMIGTTTSTSYSDTGRSPETQYCYQVLAYDSAGNESDLSAQSCACTGGEPAAPENIEITKDEDGGIKIEGCFIATAAYGSYLDPHVTVLRDFRDDYLLTNFMGRSFVRLYYRTSPPLADCIRRHECLKAATRLALTPVVYGVKHPAATLMIFGLIAGLVIYRKRKTFPIR